MTQQVIARSGYWTSLGRSLNQRADARDSSAFICKSLRLICDSNTLRVNSPLATVGALSNPRSFVTADALDDERAALGERLGLSDPALIRNRCYVNGRWLGAASGDTFPVDDPATREKLISVPNLSADETHTAIADAAAAFPSWSSMTAAARSTMLRRWHDLIVQHSDDLAKIMVAEQGKPAREAEGEMSYAASFVEWFSEEARRTYGEIIPSHDGDSRLFVLRQPVGVVAAVTPWNFPAAMVTRKAAAALAAGCVVVLKPSEETPLSALALVALAERAGLPPGVLNVVTGDAETVGGALASSDAVRKLSFTGSTDVGKSLQRRCADTVKRTSMELGGNAPFIVFDDADVNAAVDGAMTSKFRNSGQTCVCAQRFLAHASVADDFAEKLAARAAALVGGGDPGPLINDQAMEKVEAHVADALERGARALTGGERARPEGAPDDAPFSYYRPTVLAECARDARIFSEETFGPVAAVFSFETEAEAIAMANDTRSGLAAYVYTSDAERMWRVGEALEAGMVGANTGAVSTAVAPFGGVKESGVGREGGKQGIDEYLEVKYMCVRA